MKKALLILFGLVLLFFAGRALCLVLAGETARATIDQAHLMAVMDHNGSEPSYLLKTKVQYHFDIYPTPAEALLRCSEAPIKTGIKGSDILSDLSSSNGPKYSPGDQITVYYFKPFPQFNGAYQPRNLKFYGWSELILGTVLLLWGFLTGRRADEKPDAAEGDLTEEDTF